MKRSIVCGVLVRVQPQDVICADQVRGQVAIVLGDVKVPLGRSLCIGPEVPDHNSGVAVIGPGVQFQKMELTSDMTLPSPMSIFCLKTPVNYHDKHYCAKLKVKYPQLYHCHGDY